MMSFECYGQQSILAQLTSISFPILTGEALNWDLLQVWERRRRLADSLFEGRSMLSCGYGGQQSKGALEVFGVLPNPKAGGRQRRTLVEKSGWLLLTQQ